MSLKHVVVAILLLLLGATTWRVAQSDWGRGLRAAAAKPPAPIVFDNGTVRQYDSPAAVAARQQNNPLPLGTLRKCQRGGETSYTNSFCPPGSRELKLGQGTVTVVESRPVVPAAVLPGALSGQTAQPTPTLRERAVERAVHQ